MILTTHNYWDHSGGNLKLKGSTPTIECVYGGAGNEVHIGNSTQVKVLFKPCNSQGQVCYYIDKVHVFTGDIMFISGCGNFNNGSSKQMTDAFDKLLELPDDTNVWVRHEYCQDNDKLKERLKWANDQGSMHLGGKGTVFSTIGKENACNLFARID